MGHTKRNICEGLWNIQESRSVLIEKEYREESMKTLKYYIIVLPTFLLAIAGFAEIPLDILTPVQPVRQDVYVAGENQPESEAKLKPLSVDIDLVDGSHIVGIPQIKSIPVQTSYAKVDIPLRKITRIHIHDDHEIASIYLKNGDTIKGVLGLKPLELETIFGDVSVALEHVDIVVVNDGSAVWISEDATYTASSVFSGWSPLPSLLTCEGRLYIYRETNLYAFHTEIQANPSITIDLGKTKTIERICIKNRKGYGMRSKGITAWVSSDSAIRGEQVGTSDELLDEYTMTLSRPRKARFITIGLQRRDYFHLEHVKIFGQDR
jgi:hypothetical protein